MDNSQHELSFDEAVEYLLSNDVEKIIMGFQERALRRARLNITKYITSVEAVAPPFTLLTESERGRLISIGVDGFCETMAKVMRMAQVITSNRVDKKH